MMIARTAPTQMPRPHPPILRRLRRRDPRVATRGAWTPGLARHLGLWVAILACATGATAQAQVRARGSVTPDLALEGVTVIDVATGARLPDHVVVVRAGKIAAVMPRRGWRPAPGTRVLPLRGRFVIPGLWDMHVEQALPLWQAAPPDSNAEFFHPLLLAHGVTGVRDVAGPMPVVRRWIAAIERGERVGPRIVYTGPKVGQGPVAAGAPATLANAADVEATIRALKAGGAIGAYLSELDPRLMPALARALQQAELPLEGPVPPAWSLDSLVRDGLRVIDHLGGILFATVADEARVRREHTVYVERPWWAQVGWKLGVMHRPEFALSLALPHQDDERARAVFSRLARDSVFQVPTLRLLGTLHRSADSLVRLPPEPFGLRAPRRPWNNYSAEPYPATHPMTQAFLRMRWSVGAMQRAGVPLLAGSDTPNLWAMPGASLHDELALLVGAGLTPLQAIQSATIRPAQYLRATDSLGTVAAGRVADLLVLEGDPTVSIANTRRISMVVVRGTVLDTAALAAMRERARVMAERISAWWRQHPEAR
jgi:cytosine/adenosine deaminase-related metal-dependent hydrolase